MKPLNTRPNDVGTSDYGLLAYQAFQGGTPAPTARPAMAPPAETSHRGRIGRVLFTDAQAARLQAAAEQIAAYGGPQAPGTHALAVVQSSLLLASLTPAQRAVVDAYMDNHLAAMTFDGMAPIGGGDLPMALPDHDQLERDPYCGQLAARNQVLLALVDQAAFAYDIDNKGKIVRLVGNFRGGGMIPIKGEDRQMPAELSSHSGLMLGPHTEAPYHCSAVAQDSHSPAPSSLILSARWNPLAEPTRVVPMHDILASLPEDMLQALETPSFNFTRSDCFVAGKGTEGRHVSILDREGDGRFQLRFNSYRFSVAAGAAPAAHAAFDRLMQAVTEATPVELMATPASAVLINNTVALHCRAVIRDNRRLLVRLFGMDRGSRPIVLSQDPLILQG